MTLEAALSAKLAGPPAPRSQWDNLPATPQRTFAEKKPGWKDILPLMAAQAADMATTEKVINSPTPAGWQAGFEHNPMPGMGSSAGRIGLNLLEAALIGVLMKKAPKIGMPVRNMETVLHSGAALGNEANDESYRQAMRTHAIMSR